MEQKIKFKAHTQKQYDLVTSKEELTIGATGTQWGKSMAGSFWMLNQIALSRSSKDNFLLMSPTYKIMQQSMLPYFLRVMEGLGEYRKTESFFELKDGRRCYFRTETDPDSIVGIPNCRAYWLDEAGKVSLYFHENIKARAASVGATGLYTTSPYSRNWLYRDYIKKKEKGELENVRLIKAASWENPFHTLHSPINRARMRAEMDPRRFDMLFGGEWGKQTGLVYDCFDDAANIIAPHKLPNGTIFYAGVDWGHTEPFVIVVRAITPDHQHFQVAEFYKTGLTIVDQVRIAQQKKSVWNIEHFFCGHERPENILMFNQAGCSASPVPEKNIQPGTDLHYELIKTRCYKVFAGSSPYTIDEYETYHYPEPVDLKPDQDSDDQGPVGQNDHCMSANRFVTLKTYRSMLKYKPFTPSDERDINKAETQESRLKKLIS